MKNGFWLSGEQFSMIRPYLPCRAAGKRREDDRRIINRYNRWSQKGIWQYVFAELTASLSRRRRKRGASAQAIGRTKGGRNTKVNGISDKQLRPLAFYLTPGRTADIIMLGASLPKARYLLADKAYDADHWRDNLKSRRIIPVIPNKSNRLSPHPFKKTRYKGRNVIERMFGRLKDFRRVATRYDKNAENYLAALCLAALICY